MYRLQQLPDRLSLTHSTNTKIKPICVDFCSKEFLYRLKSMKSEKSLLAKAIGFKNSNAPLSIIDATAGLGRDAFILAALGNKLQLIERSQIIYELLKDGLERAKNNPQTKEIVKNIDLIQGDSLEILAKLKKEEYPDIIYLDPMFPKSNKTALVKKEMVALRNIVGADLDFNDLLKLSSQIAKNRVVVKRPKITNKTIVPPHPNFSILGTVNRFDVYCKQNSA